MKLIPSRSGSMRTWDQRIILDVFSTNTITVALSGYLFFGSAIAVSDKLVAVRTTQHIVSQPFAIHSEQHIMSSVCH